MELRPRALSSWRTPRLSGRLDRRPSDGDQAETQHLTNGSLSIPSPVRPNHSNQKFLPLLTKPAVPVCAPLQAVPLIAPQLSNRIGPAKTNSSKTRTRSAAEDSLSDKSRSEPFSACLEAQIRSSPASSVADDVSLSQKSCELSPEVELSAAKKHSVPFGSSSPPITGLLLSGLQTTELEEASGIHCCASAPPSQLQPNLTDSGTKSQPPAKRQRKSRKAKESSEHVCSPSDASNSELPSVKRSMAMTVVKSSCGNSGLHRRALSEPAQGDAVSRQPPPRFSAMLVKPATPVQGYQTGDTGRDAAEVENARALVRNPDCILPPGSLVSAHSGKLPWSSNVGSGNSSSSATTGPMSQESCRSFILPTENCFSNVVEQSGREVRGRLHAGNLKRSTLGYLQETSFRTSGFADQGVPCRYPTTVQDQPDQVPSRFSAMLSLDCTQNHSTQPEPPAEKAFVVVQPESSPSNMCHATPADHVEKVLEQKDTPARNPEDQLRAQVIECLLDPTFQALVSQMEQVLEKELGGIKAMRCLIAERFHPNRDFSSHRMEREHGSELTRLDTAYLLSFCIKQPSCAPLGTWDSTVRLV